jgi:hypothetical protein
MPMRRRTGKGRVANELLEIEMAFLRDEPEPEDPDNEFYGHWWSMGRDDDTFRPGRPPVAEMWAALGADITAEWHQERPGTRPSCWWNTRRSRAASPSGRLW